MKKQSILLASLAVFALFASLQVPERAAAATYTCTNLYTDLSYGANDSTTGSQVTPLQNFLVAAGDLSATPNGHFGPSTETAVKAFQSANNISNTGTVGPITRAAIQSQSCGSSSGPSSATSGTQTSLTGQPIGSSSTVSSTVSNTTTTTTSGTGGTVTAPAAGASVTEGASYTVAWTTAVTGTYNIIAVDQYGSEVGLIANAITGGTSYNWNSGKVFSTSANSTVTLSPGSYRIRIESTSGPSASDQVSGLFTVAGPPLTVTSVTPSTVPNDDNATVVLYGSGYDSSSRVYFDSSPNGTVADTRYASPDGKFFVFTVPNSVTAGAHTIFVTNSYSTVSSDLTVTAAQTTN